MEKKTKIIAFTNNKGGTGKTTSCANIGYSLSAMGKRVLLIDGDMQMNLSLSFFSEDEVLEFAAGEKNLYKAVSKQEDLKDYIFSTPYEKLDLIPAAMPKSVEEYELLNRWKPENVLKECLKGIRESGEYDYILIDAPPNLGGWVMKILCASDYAIMPVEASPWALFGVANMFEFLEDVRRVNEKLELLGIVITRVDTRKSYFKQTLEALQGMEGVKVFERVIRMDREVEWAQDDSKPILVHQRKARSAQEYMDLAKEIDDIWQ